MKLFQSKTLRRLLVAAFFIYLIVLFNFVFFSNYFGRVNAEVLRYQKVNLVPFKTISNYIRMKDLLNPSVFIINILGNIAAFMPFGFLLPVIVKSKRRMVWLFILSTGLSVFIEMTQGYLGVGVMDVDDVILNVLGGVLGYWVFVIVRAIVKHYGRKREQGEQ